MFHVTNENNKTVRLDLPSPVANQANYREAAIEAHRLMGGKVFRVALDGEPEGFPIRFFLHERAHMTVYEEPEWAFELLRQLYSR